MGLLVFLNTMLHMWYNLYKLFYYVLNTINYCDSSKVKVRMNLSTMDYFVVLAEEQSFTRAAQRLSVTQQSLSAHIAGVERELGVKLVNRTVPLTLTFAGEVFLGYALRFQAEHRSLLQEFADIAGDERGLLGVGIGSTRGHLLLPEAIARFKDDHPGVDVHIREGENDEVIEDLRTGRIDLAVATIPEGMAGIECLPLRHEQLVMLVSKALLKKLYGSEAEARVVEASRTHNIASLERCPLLMLGRHDQEGDLSRRLVERSGVESRIAVLSENSETLVELAVKGVGACFVELGIVYAMLDAERMRDMHIVDFGRDAIVEMQVAWRSSGHVWSVITSFVDLLVELVQEGAKTAQTHQE